MGNEIHPEKQTQNNYRIGLSEMLDMMFNWIIQQSWKVFSFFVCLFSRLNSKKVNLNALSSHHYQIVCFSLL